MREEVRFFSKYQYTIHPNLSLIILSVQHKHNITFAKLLDMGKARDNDGVLSNQKCLGYFWQNLPNFGKFMFTQV